MYDKRVYREKRQVMKGSEPGMKYFEDFYEGFRFEHEGPGLTAAEIKDFAARYDPQRFHLDEAEAAQTHFGGLVASGFQTQLLCFEPFCREVLANAAGVGSPGIDSLKWLRPWWAGEALSVSVTVAEKRASSNRADRGYLRFRLEAAVDGAPTLEMDWVVIMLTRG